MENAKWYKHKNCKSYLLQKTIEDYHRKILNLSMSIKDPTKSTKKMKWEFIECAGHREKINKTRFMIIYFVYRTLFIKCSIF